MPPWLLLQTLLIVSLALAILSSWTMSQETIKKTWEEAWLSIWETDWGDQCGTFTEIQMWRFSFCGPNNRCLWWFQSLFHIYMCNRGWSDLPTEKCCHWHRLASCQPWERYTDCANSHIWKEQHYWSLHVWFRCPHRGIVYSKWAGWTFNFFFSNELCITCSSFIPRNS